MDLVLSIQDFINNNLNLIMILVGLIAISFMFLILALDRRKVQRLERDRMKKLQEDKLLSQEMEEEFSKAINLKEEDLVDEEQVINKSKEVAEKIEEQKDKKSKKKEKLVDSVEDFNIDGDIKEEKPLENIIDENQDFPEGVVFVEEEKVSKSKKQKEEPIKKEEEIEDQQNVLTDYESVIKESDAMLETMQNIIDTNMEEVEQLEKEPLDVDNKLSKESAKNIVSKYKVQYDKVKKDWVVKKEGATRATKRCKTKEEAVDFAKKCTIDAEIGNTFHQKDGKFQKRAKK